MKKFSNTKALKGMMNQDKYNLSWEYKNLQKGEMLVVIYDTEWNFHRIEKSLVSYFSSEQEKYNLSESEQLIYVATK